MINPPPPVETPPSGEAVNAGSARPSGDSGHGLVDTHCHLFLMETDPAEATKAARGAGVDRLVCVGVDADSSRRSLELAESLRGVFATAGVHPHDASTFDRAAGTTVEELLVHPLVVGVGETGLDHYRRLSPPEDQERAFRTHIALSRETGKPLVVHVRDAWPDALRVLEDERAEHVVLHCFTGDETVATEAAARGYFLSFSGNVTYPSADHIRRAAVSVREDRLLVETDSPFLPPQSMRGQPNSPANAATVARTLADLRGLDFDLMVQRTAENTRRAFPFVR
jgi:TatD DNase family protein